MGRKGEKAQVAIDKVVGWGIGILVLVLVVILFFILKSKGINMFDYIKNLLKFGQ